MQNTWWIGRSCKRREAFRRAVLIGRALAPILPRRKGGAWNGWILRFGRHAAPRVALVPACGAERPARARRPVLPQPGAAVLSAKAGLTAEFGMGSGDPPLYGSAHGGRSPREALCESASSRAPAATLAAACALHASIPIPALKSVKKSSGYQHRSPERLAALAAAACRPGVLPGPLPNRELISEPASRLDAFSGYPFRA